MRVVDSPSDHQHERLSLCYWDISSNTSQIFRNRSLVENILHALNKDINIVALAEAQASLEYLCDLYITGFRCLSYKYREGASIRSGGLTVFVKEDVANIFHEVKGNNPNAIWLKTKNDRIGTENDMFIGTYHFSLMKNPEKDLVNKDITHFKKKGHVVLNGVSKDKINYINDFISREKQNNNNFKQHMSLNIQGNDSSSPIKTQTNRRPVPWKTYSNKKMNLLSWNIHGYRSRLIGNKLLDVEFIRMLEDIDILGLTETHIYDVILDNLNVSGFQRLSFKTRKRNAKSGTAAGGIAVFAKENVAKLFQIIKCDNQDAIWVKVKKEATWGGK